MPAIRRAVQSLLQSGRWPEGANTMKMEHTLSAPANGVVKAFLCAPGDQVAEGIELIEFEASP
jgi:pyruvate carboxylase